MKYLKKYMEVKIILVFGCLYKIVCFFKIVLEFFECYYIY